MSRTRLAAGWCCLVFAAAPCAAAEDGRQGPTFDPFSRTPETAVRAIEQRLPMAVWDDSDLYQTTTRGRPPEPSAWDKMTTGTKNFFSKTYDVLTPWDTEAEKAKARRQSAYGAKKKEKKSFFGSWWSEPDKPHQPKTVSEWLAQPRPQ